MIDANEIKTLVAREVKTPESDQFIYILSPLSLEIYGNSRDVRIEPAADSDYGGLNSSERSLRPPSLLRSLHNPAIPLFPISTQLTLLLVLLQSAK